jgi:hypothetical protein
MDEYIRRVMRKSVKMIMDAEVCCLEDVKRRVWGEYFVYVHTFPDCRRYVGQTKKDVKARWGMNGIGYKGNKRMYDEITRVGWDNIGHDVVATVYGEKAALTKENELIKEYNSSDRRYGFNTVKSVKFVYSDEMATILHFCDFYMDMWDFGMKNLGELEEGRYVLSLDKLHLKLMDAIIDMCFFMDKNDLYKEIEDKTGILGYMKRNIFYQDDFINDCWSRGMIVSVKKLEEDIYDIKLEGFAELGREPLW